MQIVTNNLYYSFDNMGVLRVDTLNVRGFRDIQKRNRVNVLFKAHNIDILFLQETHCTSIKECKQWERSFNGKCFWAFGDNHSRGVGIILNSVLNYKFYVLIMILMGDF